MTYAVLLKFLWDSKVIAIAPGWAALALLGYVEFFQLQPLHAEVTGVQDAVKDLQVAQLEERLDATYAALCMNPGDSAILQRIREQQQRYEALTENRYSPPECSLLMKIR